jgi:hypothetical protein
MLNWSKYQEDSTVYERVKKWRERQSVTVQEEKRREEKRREEKEERKALGTVVREDADAPALAEWPESLHSVQARLVELEAPDDLRDPAYWKRIDDWVGPMKLPVYYLEELRAYLAHQASVPLRSRHKEHKAGFRNWLATAIRWKERDAQRAQQQRARG